MLAIKAKKPKAKAKCVQDQYTNSYIAPELIDGSCKPSVETDTFTLCFMIKEVYCLFKLSVPPVVGTLRYKDGCFRGRLTGSNFTRVDCIAHACTTCVAVQLLSRTSELKFCHPQVNVSTFVVNSF